MNRPNRQALAIIALSLGSIAVVTLLPREVTAVILVRHAEKATAVAGDSANDPALSPAGANRAAALATMLADTGLDAVISSQYQRTMQTAEPVAEALGLAVIVIPAQEQAALIEAITGDYRGQTVLIVGHSNTVPSIMADLGVEDPPAIAEDEYGDLFIVTVYTRPMTRRVAMTRLRYGE